MKFPWTPKPRTAPLAELIEQVANAKTSLEAALSATKSAEIAFDDAGDASAEKALIAARAAEQSAFEHLGRAERLVAAANDQRKAEERAKLNARRAELEAKTTFSALTRACEPHVKRAADHLVAFAQSRIELAKQAAAFKALEDELEVVTMQLGEPRKRGIFENPDGSATCYSVDEHSQFAAQAEPILQLLEERVRGLAPQHPLRLLVTQLQAAGPCNYAGTVSNA